MDTQNTPTQGSSSVKLQVMYNPATMAPAIAVDGVFYDLDPATAEGVAKGLTAAAAMAYQARTAELN